MCRDAAFSKDNEENAFILYINRQMATEAVKQKEWEAEWEVNVREKQSMSFKNIHISAVGIGVEPLGVCKHTPTVYKPIVNCF